MAKNDKPEETIPPQEPTPKTVELKEGQSVVDQKVLTSILEKQALLEKELEDTKAKAAGVEELFAAQASNTEPTVRKKKDYEPKFRTVRIRKYPILGDIENMGYVVGWTDRGAYQKVDRSGVSPQIVDYLDIVFLDLETGEPKRVNGKLQAESVPLLDLMNKSELVVCKVLEMRKNVREIPTGEEIAVLTWDPRHGGTPVDTGERIDSYVQYTDIECVIQIPGVDKPVRIDAKYCNA